MRPSSGGGRRRRGAGEVGSLSSSPSRFQEKGNLEVLLFSIQSKLRACNRRLYVPREGCGIWDIDKVRERGRGEAGLLAELSHGSGTAQESHSHGRRRGLDLPSDSSPAVKCHEEAFSPICTKVPFVLGVASDREDRAIKLGE